MLTGEQLRDSGIALVTANNKEWMVEARQLLNVVVWKGQQVTGEEIKKRMLLVGLQQPKSKNCWGALIKWAVNHRYLQDSGKSKKCTDVSAHYRRTVVWDVL